MKTQPFPTHPIKIIGNNTPSFEKECLAIIKKKLTIHATKLQQSRDKNYVSLSVTVEVASDDVMNDVYNALGKLPFIKTVL